MRRKRSVKKKLVIEKPGELLQSLVRILERQAHSRDDIKIESPKHLPDRITGELREHDVVITYQEAHHIIITALECRDRSRKISVNEVDEFSEKCRDTGVHRGIMVSSKGFSAGALKKAAFKNIGCFTLLEAEGFDWCQAAGVFSRVRRVVGVKLLFEGIANLPSGSMAFEGGVGELDGSKIFQIGLHVIQGYGADTIPNEIVGQQNVIVVRDANPKIHAKMPSGEILKAAAVNLRITYEIDETFVPLVFHQYGDPLGEKNLGEIASATVSSGGHHYRLAIAGPKDGPKRVMIQPLGSTQTQKSTVSKRGRRKD